MTHYMQFTCSWYALFNQSGTSPESRVQVKWEEALGSDTSCLVMDGHPQRQTSVALLFDCNGPYFGMELAPNPL